MRIFCVGRNYAEHIEELRNERPTEPVLFTKPDTALLRNNAPFFVPDFSQEVHHEIEIVLKINKLGKHIRPEFAASYFDEIGLGIDFTARDVQDTLKKKGLPWDIAKGFDGSAPVSAFFSRSQFASFPELHFRLMVNDQLRQQGDTRLMLWNFEEIISHVSRYFTIRPGDYIFTGTPAGVARVQPGDRLTAYLGDELVMAFNVR